VSGGIILETTMKWLSILVVETAESIIIPTEFAPNQPSESGGKNDVTGCSKSGNTSDVFLACHGVPEGPIILISTNAIALLTSNTCATLTGSGVHGPSSVTVICIIPGLPPR